MIVEPCALLTCIAMIVTGLLKRLSHGWGSAEEETYIRLAMLGPNTLEDVVKIGPSILGGGIQAR